MFCSAISHQPSSISNQPSATVITSFLVWCLAEGEEVGEAANIILCIWDNRLQPVTTSFIQLQPVTTRYYQLLPVTRPGAMLRPLEKRRVLVDSAFCLVAILVFWLHKGLYRTQMASHLDLFATKFRFLYWKIPHDKWQVKWIARQWIARQSSSSRHHPSIK